MRGPALCALRSIIIMNFESKKFISFTEITIFLNNYDFAKLVLGLFVLKIYFNYLWPVHHFYVASA